MRKLALFALLWTACAQGSPEGESQAAITGGSVDSGDVAVALLLGQSGNVSSYVCSASFLAPNVLLTAAHCFDDSSLTFSIGTAESYDVSPGSMPSGMHAVSSVAIDPSYDPSSAAPRPHDLAVIRVSSNVGTATLPFHAAAPDSSWIGQPMRIVGYGRTSAKTTDDGTRHAASTVLDSFTATELVIANHPQDCTGDSGGPALMTLDGVQTIVGVSAASTADCSTRGYYGRIDGDIDFIDAELNGTGTTGGGSGGGGGGGSTMGGCNLGGGGMPRLFGGLALLVALALRRRA